MNQSTVNTYNNKHIAPNNRVPKSMKQNLSEVKGEKIIGDTNTPLFIMYRTIRQKISKEIEDGHNTTSKLDLTDIENTPCDNSRITHSSQVHIGPD